VTLLTFATWIAVAVVTAWGAGTVMKYGGHGRRADILLGLTASGAACEIAWSLDLLPEPGIVATAILAFAAAAAVITLQRRFFYAPLQKVRAHTGRR
jgi:hypothetical protein